MYNDFYDIISKASIIILIGTILIFLLFSKKKDGKDWISVVCFTIVFFVGIELYYFGIIYTKKENYYSFSTLFTITSSLIFSFTSFIGKFNNQNYLTELAEKSQIFRVAVVIHFITAVFLTSYTVIWLFGKKLINEIRVWFISMGKKYIVIGSGEKAMVFLKNLSKKTKKKTIVILENSQEDKKIELIKKGFAVLLIGEDKKNKNKNLDEFKKIKNMAFFIALKKAGGMNCWFDTKVIAISEYDEVNLLIARILTAYINKKTGEVKKENNKIKLTKKQEKILERIKLDIRIMYSFLERVEHFTYIDNSYGKITFFNYNKLNAQKFCMENPITRLIPKKWINTNQAKLRENYKIGTIFVGFGAINKAMLKTSIINNQLLDINYNALVVCKDAEMHQKIFENSSIGLFDKKDNKGKLKYGAEIDPKKYKYLDKPKEKNIIKFKEADAMTVDLYDIINNETKLYDYTTIIISLGDDRLNIETALELRQKLYEAELITACFKTIEDKEEKYQRVKIFVKIKESSVYTDEKIINNENNKKEWKLITYGADDEILTEENIINEKLDTLAINIANRYEGNKDNKKGLSSWNKLTQHKRESNRYAAMAIQVKLNLLGFNLVKEEQKDNFSDQYKEKYGIDNAIKLRAERIKIVEEIKKARKRNEDENIDIPEELIKKTIDNEILFLAELDDMGKFIETVRNNLAKLEHQRWNVFHLANDWTKLPIEKIGVGNQGRQNEIGKQHACITTFEGLIKLMHKQNKKEMEEIEENNKKIKEEKEKNKEKQYIEAESLLNADTINYDFSTMDFLVELSEDNQKELRKAYEVNNNKKKENKFTYIINSLMYLIDKLNKKKKKDFSYILEGSGYYIGELKDE